MIEKWKDYLPIKDYQPETNIRSSNNISFVFDKASRIYTVYVADDDLIKMSKLSTLIFGTYVWTIFSMVNWYPKNLP